jgi:hypothetical protein
MLRANAPKLFVRLFVLGVLAMMIWFFSGRASTQIPPPRISVEQQPDSPLLISSIYMTSPDPFKPQYGYTIANIKDKPIRAYAIKEDIRFGERQAGTSGVDLSHLPSLKLLLQPNQSRSISADNSSKYTQPVNEIILSVDFVEFSDGSTWGNDSFNSAQRLAGQRAGGKAALKRFRESLKTGEPDSLTDAIIQDDVIQSDNQVSSQDWHEGFQTGVGIVRNRLKEAKRKGGGAEVVKELEKPFDASEGRQ